LGSDDKIHDPPRVMRLPGFMNTKPPLARCGILECYPEKRHPLELFPRAVEPPRAHVLVEATGGRRSLSKSTLEFIVNGAAPGSRNGRLFKAAADCHGCGYTQVETEARLVPPAIAAGLTEAETLGAIASAYSKPRSPSVPDGPSVRSGSTPVVRRLSEVQSRTVEWLWHGRIAVGKVTLVVGDPGLGKSFMTLDMAARVSAGRGFPGAGNVPSPPGGVVLLSAEDDLADTIRPRLESAGADLTRITALESIQQNDLHDGQARMFDLGRDLAALEKAIRDEPGCRLVIIDPVSAYLGDTDSHKNTSVRAVLAPLAELARCLSVAVIAVSHLRKGEGSAIHRTMGSLAFVAAARAAFAVTRDPDDATGRRRLLIPIKNNIGNDQTGLAFTLSEAPASEPERVPSVQWTEESVTLTAEDAIGTGVNRQSEQRDPIDDASEWLEKFLELGPVAATEVIANAKEAGIAARTLNRAKSKVGIVTSKQSFTGPWTWALARRAPPITRPRCLAAEGVVATFDESGNLRQSAAETEVSEHSGSGSLGEGCHTNIAGGVAQATTVADSGLTHCSDVLPRPEMEHLSSPLHSPHAGPSVAKAADRPAEGV
jgi:hypothetical protein